MARTTDGMVSGLWKQHLADWSRALFEGIDDAVIVHDLNGRILDANDAACRRLGYSRTEMLMLTTADIDDEEFAKSFDERLKVQMTEGKLRCEGRHKCKDGKTILVDINSSAIEFHDKPCVLSVVRDITEKKKAEQVLVKQKELLRSILENMADGVLVVNSQNQILISNPIAQRLFGLKKNPKDHQFHWPPNAKMFLPDQVSPFPPRSYPWTRAHQGKSVSDVQMFVRVPGNNRGRWVNISARPLKEQGQTNPPAVVVCHDITEQKRGERRQEMQAAIARVITSSSNQTSLAKMLLRSLCDGLGWDVGVLWVIDEEEACIRCVNHWHRPELNLLKMERLAHSGFSAKNQGLSGKAWANAAPLWISDVQQESIYSNFHQEFADAGLRTAFAFPLWSSGKIIGVIEGITRNTDPPDHEMLMLVATLGSQIGQLLERQNVEKALRESEALYASLVETLPQYLFRKDVRGRFTFGNQRYCELVGVSLKELIGKTDFDLFPKNLANKYREDDKKVLKTGTSLELVEEHILQDGQTLHVQVVKAPILDAKKELMGIQGLFWDVTKRINAERDRLASERRYRQLTEATQDAIIVTDATGRVTLFNPAAEKMFGYECHEIMGQLVDILIPEDLLPKHKAGMARFVQTGVPRIIGKPVELLGRRKDATVFPMEIVLTEMERDSQAGSKEGKSTIHFLGAIRDLTERNRMRTTLIHNEKLASIGLLSAGIAHEINNPLAFISNNVAVMEIDLSSVMNILALYEESLPLLEQVDQEKAHKIRELSEEFDLEFTRSHLSEIVAKTRMGVNRVAKIVQSLHGLARTGPAHRKDTHLPDLIESTIALIGNRIRQMNIEYDFEENSRIECVPTEMSQVLLNLIVNALQAIDERQPNEGGIIKIRTFRRANEMCIEVGDNGCGIPDEIQGRIFDPFFTTKDVGEGTGLGLAISSNIIASHQGKLEIESVVGEGTIFRIVVPLN